MANSRTLIVNILGSPGAGKSTLAAYLFSQLKKMRINCELVTEVAKDMTWEHNEMALNCQPYLFGKQTYRIDRCVGQVDVIITDSPLILSLLYNKDEAIEPEFTELVKKKFSSYWNLNILLKRVQPYNPIGRNQTEEEADKIHYQLVDLVLDTKIPFIIQDGNEAGADKILEMIVEKVKNEKKSFN